MTVTPNTPWDGTERRQPNSCRRKNERRSLQERRSDRRDPAQNSRRGFYGWLRSLIRTRLGVDRRKNGDQRTTADRRRMNARALLTKEELADLLSETRNQKPEASL